jgi:hypothetical protein
MKTKRIIIATTDYFPVVMFSTVIGEMYTMPEQVNSDARDCGTMANWFYRISRYYIDFHKNESF